MNFSKTGFDMLLTLYFGTKIIANLHEIPSHNTNILRDLRHCATSRKVARSIS
jgi:hypothetical protein